MELKNELLDGEGPDVISAANKFYEVANQLGVERHFLEYSSPAGICDLLEALNIPDQELPKLQQYAEALAKVALRKHTYWAKRLSALAGKPRMLYESAKQNGIKIEGQASPDLTEAITQFGDALEIDCALYQLFSDGFRFEEWNNLAKTGKVLAIEKQIIRLHDSFRRQQKLPNKPEISMAHMNAAANISREKYDLVIGILKGGASVPSLCDALGQSTGYLEWHKHWTRNPIWKNVALNRAKLRENMKILLCENDAATGETLSEIVKKIEAIHPESLDILFTGFYTDRSLEIAKQFPFNHVESLRDQNLQHIYTNLLAVRAALRRVQVANRSAAESPDPPFDKLRVDRCH